MKSKSKPAIGDGRRHLMKDKPPKAGGRVPHRPTAQPSPRDAEWRKPFMDVPENSGSENRIDPKEDLL